MEHRLPADAKMTFFRWSSFDARDGSQRARFNSPEYALHDLISKRFAAHHSPRTTRTEIHEPAMRARLPLLLCLMLTVCRRAMGGARRRRSRQTLNWSATPVGSSRMSRWMADGLQMDGREAPEVAAWSAPLIDGAPAADRPVDRPGRPSGRLTDRSPDGTSDSPTDSTSYRQSD